MIEKIITKIATKVLYILLQKIELLINADLDGDGKIG